jgi:hypothetical protein
LTQAGKDTPMKENHTEGKESKEIFYQLGNPLKSAIAVKQTGQWCTAKRPGVGAKRRWSFLS